MTPRLNAVFLAAGFATRMYPLTRERAKPLLEVGGQPLLTRLVQQAHATGLLQEAIVVHNGRFGDAFRDWSTGDLPLPVTLIDDGVLENDKRLGAVADLDLALRQCTSAGAVDGWLVLAGDNLFEFGLEPFAQRLFESGRPQLLVRRVPSPVPPGKYSEVTIDAQGHVRSFREKPADPVSDLSAIGAYAFPPELPAFTQRYLAAGGNPDAPGHFVEWLVREVEVDGSLIEGAWFDIGSLEDLERARARLG